MQENSTVDLLMHVGVRSASLEGSASSMIEPRAMCEIKRALMYDEERVKMV